MDKSENELKKFKLETKRQRYLDRKSHQERKLERRCLRKAQWKSKTR